jgi:hypothetical protein
MPIVVPNEGELVALDYMLKDTSVTAGCVLRLYTNDYTPVAASTDGDFTEATFTNYAEVTLTRSSWNAAVTNGSGKAESSYGASPQSWTCGASGNTVYGYWVETTDVTPTILWAERFGTARVLADGDILNIQPKFSLSSEN